MGNSYILFFISDNPGTSESEFARQHFIFNVVNASVIVGLLLLSLLIFRDNHNYKQRDQRLWSNVKVLLTDANFVKMMLATCLSNGVVNSISSIINIIGEDHEVPSYMASICVFVGTVLGLLWSIAFVKVFRTPSSHRLWMSLGLYVGGLCMLGFSLGLYLRIRWLFYVCYLLYGTLNLVPIPFFMEKCSVDFKNQSFNIINLSRSRANRKCTTFSRFFWRSACR